MRLHGNPPTAPENEKTPDDVSQLIRTIAQAIHGEAGKIFKSCPWELLNESPDFVTPAVRGLTVNGQLMPLQQQISARVPPIIEEVLTALQFKELNGAQRFAIDYLVRALITIEISLMVQILRFEILCEVRSENATTHNLATLEPLGNA